MGREEHCKQISLACVGTAHRVWATLDLPLLMACVLSWSKLLRFQVSLQSTLEPEQCRPEKHMHCEW